MHASGVRPLPLACVRFLWHRGLIIRLPTLRSLGIVRRFGRVSVPFTNEQCPYSGKKGEESQESLS